MTDSPQPGDFDKRPPMPVTDYEQTVKRVNVGYDLLFTLTQCFLQALRQPQLNLLVVGAGGGQEIECFLPGNPGWRIIGVDPSQDMLALARAKAARLNVADRVTLVQGTVDDLPATASYDVATCLYVLHFLPEDGKLALLRGIASRIRPDAPVLIVSGTMPTAGGLRDDFLGAWQQYGELMGMPAEQMATTIAQVLARQDTTTEADYVRLLRAAGFTRVAPYFSVIGGLTGWIAR